MPVSRLFHLSNLRPRPRCFFILEHLHINTSHLADQIYTYNIPHLFLRHLFRIHRWQSVQLLSAQSEPWENFMRPCQRLAQWRFRNAMHENAGWWRGNGFSWKSLYSFLISGTAPLCNASNVSKQVFHISQCDTCYMRQSWQDQLTIRQSTRLHNRIHRRLIIIKIIMMIKFWISNAWEDLFLWSTASLTASTTRCLRDIRDH